MFEDDGVGKKVTDVVFEPQDDEELTPMQESSALHDELQVEQGKPDKPEPAQEQKKVDALQEKKVDDKPADPLPQGPPAEADQVRDITQTTWEYLELLARDPYNFQDFKLAHEEMIRRVDAAMPPAEFKKSLESIPILLKALKEGKLILVGADGEQTLSDQPLTPADRMRYHEAISHDLNIIGQQSVTRLDYSQRLYSTKQYADAEKFGKEAIQKSDLLPKALIEQAGKQLIDDLRHIADPDLRKEMQKRAIGCSSSTPEPSLYRMPLMTRKSLATMYLGTELTLKAGGKVDVAMGRNNAFKPDKAYELAKETREKTKELLGFDPMDEKAAREDPSVATIFGSMMEVLDNPEKYNLYKLVDLHKVAEMNRELKKSCGFDSMLVDIGVVTLFAGSLFLARSPKTHAAVERMLGHTANAETIAPVLSQTLGWGTAVVGAPLLRHYGFETLTGVKETWTDTGVHVLGSLAAAEIGGQLLGRGSMVMGSRGRGIRALEEFDALASSEWLSMKGYKTTGQLGDFLRSSGFLREADIVLKLPRGTALASEAGLKALEAAELRHSRMASVSRAVEADKAAASGIDHTKLADSLGSNKSIKDVDGLLRQLQEDAQILKAVDEPGLRRGTSISDALGQSVVTPEGTKIQERLAELGVENVGQARDLLKSLDKGLESQFPKLYELQKANVIKGSTSLAEVAGMTSHAFDGPGMTRLIKLLPEAERPAILTDKTLHALSMGEKPQTKIQQMVAAQYNSLGFRPSADFLNAPSLKNTVCGPALKGAAGTVLTYNSIVKAWDQTQYINPNTGQNYTFAEALQEAHLPGLDDPNVPQWLRLVNAIGSGSPGQIILGSLLVRPGAIARPVWSDASLSTSSKVWNSSPLSSRAWNNWNAGIFSKPGMGSAGALSGALIEPAKTAALEGTEHKNRMRRMLENVQKPIENEAPPQR